MKNNDHDGLVCGFNVIKNKLGRISILFAVTVSSWRSIIFSKMSLWGARNRQSRVRIIPNGTVFEKYPPQRASPAIAPEDS
jgi:hypothetical protein